MARVAATGIGELAWILEGTVSTGRAPIAGADLAIVIERLPLAFLI
jgi:hypothetical protein